MLFNRKSFVEQCFECYSVDLPTNRNVYLMRIHFRLTESKVSQMKMIIYSKQFFIFEKNHLSANYRISICISIPRLASSPNVCW